MLTVCPIACYAKAVNDKDGEESSGIAPGYPVLCPTPLHQLLAKVAAVIKEITVHITCE